MALEVLDVLTLIIRADAGSGIGVGHVMRMIALGQEWKRTGGRVIFMCCELPDALARRLEREGFELVRSHAIAGSNGDAEDLQALAHACSKHAWVVLDGYHLLGDYQRAVYKVVPRVLVMDDMARADVDHATVVLDQNLSASATAYPDGGVARLLLGTRYTLLRREFLRAAPRPRGLGAEKHVVITLGGSDPAGLGGGLMERLAAMPGITLTLVVGSADPRATAWLGMAERLGPRVRVLLDPTDMTVVLDQADLVVAAAGSTAWELAYLGVPALLVVVADNQQAHAAALQREGVAVVLHASEALDAVPLALDRLVDHPEQCREMSRRGRELVDGWGARRVAAHLRSFLLHLRKAGPADKELVWEWANQPATRAVSFSEAAIPFAQHSAWFDARMADNDCWLAIAEDLHGRAIGQVRVDDKGQEAIISVGLADDAQGRGWGPVIIAKASGQWMQAHPGRTIKAFIKEDNHPSITAFRLVGYEQTGVATQNGQLALEFELQHAGDWI